MKCPNCGVEAPAGATECAACAIIFAKFQAQREREKKEAAEFLALPEQKPFSAPKYWRYVAAISVLIWLGALTWYYVNALNDREERLDSQLRARSRAAALPAPASPR